MFRLSDLTEAGRVLRDAEFARTGFASANEPGTLACAAGRGYLEVARKAPGIAALVVGPDLAEAAPGGLGLAVAEDPEIAFYCLHNRLVREFGMGVGVESHVDPSAEIHPSAVIEPGCRIGPGVQVDACAVVRTGTVLEAGVVVGPGAVIGCDAAFSRRRPGLLLKVLHAGGVHVGRDTEIQARSVVLRGVHPEFTRIGARVLIGTGVTVSHGAHVKDEATIMGSAVVCGYATIGAGAWVGPHATVSNLIGIGDGARVEIGATVVRSVPAGGRYSGLFARPHAAMRDMSRTLHAMARREDATP